MTHQVSRFVAFESIDAQLRFLCSSFVGLYVRSQSVFHLRWRQNTEFLKQPRMLNTFKYHVSCTDGMISVRIILITCFSTVVHSQVVFSFL